MKGATASKAGRHTPRSVEGIGGVLLMAVALALPATYFAVGWKAQEEHLRTDAEIRARQVTDLINRNPEGWKFETIRLEGILVQRADAPRRKLIRILDSEGREVLRQRGVIEWPRMGRAHPLRDSGVVVGTLEESASLRPLLLETAVLAGTGTAVTLLLFLLFRTYPMSALRNALDSLSRETHRAKVTLQSIGDGVISCDPQGRVLLLNRMAEKMTGWTQEDAAGKPLEELFHPDGDMLVDRSGVVRRIESVISAVRDDDGRDAGSVLVIRDVTERTQAEAAMANAQKLESLGVLAGGIAHEIRNPLSSINISISSIRRACEADGGLAPETSERIGLILEQMQLAAAKMGSVVQRVLDFSRPLPPRKGISDPNRIIEEAIQMSLSTLRKRGIEVHWDLTPDLPPCRVDAQMIEQVLVNLVTNACQAMESVEGAKHLEVGSAVVQGRVVLRVSDSGPGVPASLRQKIFDPFFTTRKDGSGIGLSFSHRIVADHGGSLCVGTSRWGGAEFRIELPTEREGVPA